MGQAPALGHAGQLPRDLSVTVKLSHLGTAAVVEPEVAESKANDKRGTIDE